MRLSDMASKYIQITIENGKGTGYNKFRLFLDSIVGIEKYFESTYWNHKEIIFHTQAGQILYTHYCQTKDGITHIDEFIQSIMEER